jgi:hypothetical protein
MTKDHALSRLLRRIKEEEQRTRQYAVRVRISRSVGLDIAAMDAADWHDASNGWTEMDQCKKLASDFLKEGEAAAQGLRLSVVGPVLEVSTVHDAPDVEIIEGRSFDDHVA